MELYLYRSKNLSFKNVRLFTSDTSDIIILNQNEKVISSNEREYLNGEGKKELEMILDQSTVKGRVWERCI